MLQHCHWKLEWTKSSLYCMHACLESNALLIFVVTNLKKIAAIYQSLIRPNWTGTKKWFHNCQCTSIFNTVAAAKESGKQGSRAGPLYKLQNTNPISDMTPRRPKGWSQSSNTSCNSNPKYFRYDTGHLNSSSTRYLNSSTTRNLNLNLNSSTHQESESELFPEQGISVTNWFPVEGLGLEPEIRSTLCDCCCCVYKLLKEKESKKQEGIWIVSVWTEETIKPK